MRLPTVESSCAGLIRNKGFKRTLRTLARKGIYLLGCNIIIVPNSYYYGRMSPLALPRYHGRGFYNTTTVVLVLALDWGARRLMFSLCRGSIFFTPALAPAPARTATQSPAAQLRGYRYRR